MGNGLTGAGGAVRAGALANPRFTCEQKMRLCLRLCFSTVALLIAVLPAAAGVVITIDESMQRMTVAVDGTTRHFVRPNNARVPSAMRGQALAEINRVGGSAT